MQKRLSLLLMLLIWLSVSRGAEVPIELQNCTYDQLQELVQQSKGKIVLVQFWGDFCLPCKKKFPELVTIQKNYLARGLRCFSVSVDDFEDQEVRSRAVEFLKQQKAVFTHLILTEPPKVWQEKLKIAGPPCVFLFDTEGQLVQKYYAEAVQFDKIEKRIRQLMNLD